MIAFRLPVQTELEAVANQRSAIARRISRSNGVASHLGRRLPMMVLLSAIPPRCFNMRHIFQSQCNHIVAVMQPTKNRDEGVMRGS
jgi:hypothetical protein